MSPISTRMDTTSQQAVVYEIWQRMYCARTYRLKILAYGRDKCCSKQAPSLDEPIKVY